MNTLWFCFIMGLVLGVVLGHFVGGWYARKKAQWDMVRNLWR